MRLSLNAGLQRQTVWKAASTPDSNASPTGIAAGPGNANGKCSSGTSTPKKQLPDDPLDIARQCNFGQDQLAKVNDLAEEDHNKADQETGRPAFYDNAIPTEYEHSIGIRKGPMK